MTSSSWRSTARGATRGPGNVAGLIVNVSSAGGARYLFNAAYGAAKAALERLAADMARELQPHGVAALSIRPSMVATERTKATPHLWMDRATPGEVHLLEVRDRGALIGVLPEAERKDLQSVVSNLQLAYADAASAAE